MNETVLVTRRRLKQATDIGYQAGHAAARAEAEALLREALPHLHLCADLSLADRVNAYLAGGKT